MILWMLYHVCRYRDNRNKARATSRNFHDDDNLDDSAGEGKTPIKLNTILPLNLHVQARPRRRIPLQQCILLLCIMTQPGMDTVRSDSLGLTEMTGLAQEHPRSFLSVEILWHSASKAF